MAKEGKKILRRLVERNLFYSSIMSNREKTTAGHWRPAGKPGDAILRLPQEDRDALAKLKPEDMDNERWPLYDGLDE